MGVGLFPPSYIRSKQLLNLEDEDIVYSFEKLKVLRISVKTGTYDSSTGTWTDGGTTYSLSTNGDRITISGSVPYEDADATLGFNAGNRVALKISNENITSKSQLPSGTIVKTKAGEVVQEYTKSAFEDDGTLIHIQEIGASKHPFTIEIKWASGETFSKYTFDPSGVTLAAQA